MPVKDSPVWFPVFVTEILVIFIINGITIAVFARIRHLRKRSTYLIINLTVADLLVGAVTAPLLIDHHDEETNVLTWSRFIIMAIESVFPVASQVNLFLIALERLHATLFPFRHCLITKWLYFKFIVGSWLVILLIAFVMPSLPRHASPYAWASLSTVTLLVLTVCYTIIIVNVLIRKSCGHMKRVTVKRGSIVKLLTTTEFIASKSWCLLLNNYFLRFSLFPAISALRPSRRTQFHVTVPQ